MDYKLLSASEVSLLKELLKVFSEAFEDKKTYQDFIPSDDYLRDLLIKDHFLALVATEKGQVVGGLTAYILEKFEQARKEIYIYDLAVAKDYRRQGIATGLINKLKKIAKDKECYAIFVQADKGDDAAIKLYESLGDKEEVLHFDIKLS